jgi:hypothetical protein
MRGSHYTEPILSKLLDAWNRASAALDAAEQDFTADGPLRRIYVNDRLADAAYRMAELFKERGQHEESNAAHRQGNKYWGRVTELVGELDDAKEPPKKEKTFEGTDAEAARAAADHLMKSRQKK